jgi:hypothetical protein
MSITIKGVTSGGVDLKAPDTGSNTTVTLPSATGTLLPTDGNGSALTNLTSANLVGALPALDGSSLTGIVGIPSGVILMWSGASSAIPTGWNLCDGNNGTPNLTGKFIKSATTAGGTGGSASTGAHTLTVAEMPSHTHPYEGGTNAQASAHMGKGYYGHQYLTTQATGGGGGHSHTLEPVYYALIYIMKA